MPRLKDIRNPMEPGDIRSFQMMISDPVCFVLVLLRCRYSLHNAVHKDKENNNIKMDHLVRPGEYSLPFTFGFIWP